MRVGQDMSVAPGHHLLPHERWAASYILKRQSTHRTPAILRIEQNYGPIGIALWGACLITALPGELIACMGIVLMLASGGNGSILSLGYKFVGIGIALILLASIRVIQGIKAGRAFRGKRPFLRR